MHPAAKALADHMAQALWRADLSTVPIDRDIKKSDYRDALEALQDDLGILHNAYMAGKRRAILVFEGWDAAGKGGAIKRLITGWDPRGYKVWPISAPDAHERARHYQYRFWRRLPANGEIAVFDRSWYGRVLVERVEGFCSQDAWQRAYAEINQFEQTLIDNGSAVLKFFVQVSPDEQARRFHDRLEVPHKRWKLTEEDFRNRAKRPEYEAATHDMLAKTHTRAAPWLVVPGENKRYARIAVLGAVRDWLDTMDLPVDPPADPALVALAETNLKK